MPKLIMPKLVMLRKTDEFSSVFSFRKRFSSRFLVVHYKPNQQSEARIGFVVAKKVARLAVDRNYMRRVLRELCRQELPIFANVGVTNVNSDSVDIIIQVQKPFKNADFIHIKQELVLLFAKIQQKCVLEQAINA